MKIEPAMSGDLTNNGYKVEQTFWDILLASLEHGLPTSSS